MKSTFDMFKSLLEAVVDDDGCFFGWIEDIRSCEVDGILNFKNPSIFGWDMDLFHKKY